MECHSQCNFVTHRHVGRQKKLHRKFKSTDLPSCCRRRSSKNVRIVVLVGWLYSYAECIVSCDETGEREAKKKRRSTRSSSMSGGGPRFGSRCSRRKPRPRPLLQKAIAKAGERSAAGTSVHGEPLYGSLSEKPQYVEENCGAKGRR